MSLHVHLTRSPGEPFLTQLNSQLDPGIALTLGPDLPQPARFQVLVDGSPTREKLAASPHLQALVIPWAGLPEAARELLPDFPAVSVHNLHHNAAQTAEMALALMLSAARRIVPADRQLRLGDWTIRYEPPPVLILEGKTALILGYGTIGQHVARVCQALGMRILAVRRHPAAPVPAGIEASVYPLVALHRLLPQADVLVITLPLTAETEGLVGLEELALLPPHGLLVNVGRGAVVDEAALYRALESGRLGAAGLDVWYRYPESRESRTHTFPSRFPFHELDNVVMSPHRGGAFGSAYTEEARMDHLARLLNAAARGDPIPNRIDLAQGY